MNKKIKIAVLLCVVAVVLGAIVTASVCIFGKVRIKDKGLKEAYEYTYTCGGLLEKGKISDKKLLESEELCIKNLNDIGSFSEIYGNTNLKYLTIGCFYSENDEGRVVKSEWISDSNDGNVDTMNDEKIEKIQNELGELIASCPNIQTVYIADANEIIHFTSLDFLAKGENKLMQISLNHVISDDYSGLYKCSGLWYLEICDIEVFDDEDLAGIDNLSELGVLNLENVNIKTADCLLGFDNIKSISISDTQLCDNVTEIKRIYEKYEGAELLFNGCIIDVIMTEDNKIASDKEESFEKYTIDEQIEIFAQNSDAWIDKDDRYAYVSVSDMNSDSILEFYVQTYGKWYPESMKVYQCADSKSKLKCISDTKKSILYSEEKDGFIEKVNCFDKKYYSRLSKNSYEERYYTDLYDYSFSGMNKNENNIYFYLFKHENGDFDVYFEDNDWKHTDYDSYVNWEKSLVEDYQTVDTVEFSWKKMTPDSISVDVLMESLNEYKVTENHYADPNERLSEVGENISYLGYVDYESFKKPTMYSVAEYCGSFAEAQKANIDENSKSLLYSSVCAMGEDALTDEIKQKTGNCICVLKKVDKEKFEEFYTEVLPFSSLEDCYNEMTEAPNENWDNLHEMGVFYSKEDESIYAYMFAIGYYMEATAVSNEPYKDGYMAKFISGDLSLNATISKETCIYYVLTDNGFGYEIISIDSEDNAILGQ